MPAFPHSSRRTHGTPAQGRRTATGVALTAILTIGASGQAAAACSTSTPTTGATVTCSDADTTGIVGNAGVNNVTVNVTNTGSVIVPSGVAINEAGTGWTINNAGTITGVGIGVFTGATAANATVYNTGTITSTTSYGINLGDGGTATNYGTVTGATQAFVAQTASATLYNYGLISSAGTYGVHYTAGGAITNYAGGTISGGAYGLLLDGGTAATNSVTNSGTITGTTAIGAYLFTGGTLTNNATGTITGNSGAAFLNGVGTLINAGTITGTGNYGVTMSFGGTVTNTGTITGYGNGLIASNFATVTNSGTIQSTNTTSSFGILLYAGGTVVNEYTGIITSAGGVAIKIDSATASSFTNRGSVTGNVIMNDGDSTLNLEAGSTLNGTIDGKNGNNVLNLLAGISTSGTLSSAVSNFQSLVVNAADTKWVFTGSGTFTSGTTISAGTLQVGDGTTAGTLSGNVLNNGTLSFNHSDAVALAGVISGTGLVSQIGAGTLTLSGANSYSGGTLIASGTLAISADNNIGTGALAMLNGTALSFLNGFTFTHGVTVAGDPTIDVATGNTNTMSGVIADGVQAGDIVKTGAGTLVFTADNTYTGGTTISAGTLQLGNGTTTGSVVGNITNNGVLAVNRSDTYTLRGAIDGTGSLQQIGTGTTILTGTNTYTGGTVISAGTLQVGDGTTAGSIVGDVLNNGTFAVNLSSPFTLSGTISGTGAFQQVGTGTTVLTGTNTYTGATTVTAGTLIVNGSIAASSGLTVDPGATVGGTGTLPTSVVRGTLSPGNSIGTITIAGNLTFVGPGTYLVEISPAANDLTRVTGTASLSGTIKVLPTAGSYTIGKRYVVLSAAGGISGRFDVTDFTTGFGSAYRPRVDYDANDVFIVLDPKAISPLLIGGTRNERAVADGIDAALAAGNTPARLLSLFNLSSVQLPAALDALSGEVHASAASVLVNESLYARQSLLGRMRQIVTGDGATPESSFNLGGPQVVAPGAPTDDARRGASPFPVKAPPARSVQDGPDIAFWAHGFGAWGRLASDGNAAALDTNFTGFFSGVDARLASIWRAGVAAGYTQSRNTLSGRGTANIEAGHLAAYSTVGLGPLSLRTGADYAWQTLDTDRTVAIPGLFDRPTAHYQARTTQVFGEAGYAFALGAFTIEPFAGAAWVSVQTPQVSERGDVAALTIAAHDAAVGYSTLGLRAAGAIPLGAGAILIPRLSAAWQHAFNSLTPETVMTFQTTGTSFVIAGVTGARDTALAEAGLDVAIGPRLTLGASYIGSYARALMDHAVKGKLSWKL